MHTLKNLSMSNCLSSLSSYESKTVAPFDDNQTIVSKSCLTLCKAIKERVENMI